MPSRCPTCGSNVVQIVTGTGASRYVMCAGCGREAPVVRAETAPRNPADDSVARWSSRSSQPPTTSRTLRDALSAGALLLGSDEQDLESR
jgi:uncharacterized Zn finger protein (UPF0148 family)